MVRKIIRIALAVFFVALLFCVTFALQGGWWYSPPEAEWTMQRGGKLPYAFAVDNSKILYGSGATNAYGKSNEIGWLQMHDLYSGLAEYEIGTHRYPTGSANIHFDGNRKVYVYLDSQRQLDVHDLEKRKLDHSVRVDEAVPKGVERCVVSKSANELFVCADSQRWYAIEIRTGKSRLALVTGPSLVCRCDDGEHVITSSPDRKTLEYWSLSSGKRVWSREMDGEMVVRTEQSPRGGPIFVHLLRDDGVKGKEYVRAVSCRLVRPSDGKTITHVVHSDTFRGSQPIDNMTFRMLAEAVVPSYSISDEYMAFLETEKKPDEVKETYKLCFASIADEKDFTAIEFEKEQFPLSNWGYATLNQFGLVIHSRAAQDSPNPPAWFAKIPNALKKPAVRLLDYFDTSKNYEVLFFDPRHLDRSPTKLRQTSFGHTQPFLSRDGKVMVTEDHNRDESMVRVFHLPILNRWPKRALISLLPVLVFVLLLLWIPNKAAKQFAPPSIPSPAIGAN